MLTVTVLLLVAAVVAAILDKPTIAVLAVTIAVALQVLPK